MISKQLSKKVEKVLKSSKKPLDQVEIAERINENPFVVSKILCEFQRRGMVAVEQ